MRIINQSGNLSISFDNADIFRTDSLIIAEKYKNKGDILLGRYETTERAMEVFKNIHENYARNTLVYEMPQK